VGQDFDASGNAVASGSVGDNGVHVVCTTAEGAYFNGVAALTNSLVRAGFKGSVVVGYRGEKPAWLATLAKDPKSDAYLVTSEVCLQLVEAPGTWNLANQKARLMNRILRELVPDADLVYYFDADIVIKRSWETFAGWARHGVVLALDYADSYMSPHHVYRRAWQAMAARKNLKCRDFTGYVNGGCIGVNRVYAKFIDVCSVLMEELEKDGADMRKLKNWAGPVEFSRMDQDILNATVMATDVPIALLGSEAMGMFPWANVVMPHTMFHAKPWSRKYIYDALRGFPPDRTHLAYWEFVDGPIRPFSGLKLKMKKREVSIAHLIGLFHSRSYRDL